MIRIIKSLIIIIFFSAITIQANSETSWITKKSDKSKTDTKKVVKETKSNNWIKKKEVKENKKKLKEKIKESKSWITKKSKKKLKDIKNNLKKHKNIDQLPKAEFYFTAIITGKNDQEDRYVYGYVNSNKKSDLINFNNKSFYSVSDGIAYFENKNNSCVVDSLLTPMRSQLSGDVVIKCKKNLKMTGGFLQIGDVGKGIGETSEGNNIEFEFYTSKDKAIAKLDDYKNKEIRLAHSSFSSNNSIDLKPTGKYYALLIGNSKYANWASLTSPVNDVNEIETLLTKKYNFEKVIIIQNGTREKIFDAFDQLSQITTDNDYVLVYYSGHGDQKGNKSYWIPTNAKKKYSSKWINIKDIENYLEEIPAHHLAIMVDSCYFTGFKGSNKIDEKKSKHYKKFLNKRARIVLASGQNEPVSDTGAGNNSVFGKTLIQALENSEGAISLGEIGLSIGYAHANMNQMPIYATYNHWGHGGGDFVFIPIKK